MSDNNKTRTLHEIFECQLPNNLEPVNLEPVEIHTNDEYECTCSEDPFVKPIMPMSFMKRATEIDLIMANQLKFISKETIFYFMNIFKDDFDISDEKRRNNMDNYVYNDNRKNEKEDQALQFLVLTTAELESLDYDKREIIDEHIKDCFNKTYNCIKYNYLISTESPSEFNEKTKAEMYKLCEFLLQELEKNLESDIKKETMEYLTPLLMKDRELPHLEEDIFINIDIEQYFKYHKFTPTKMCLQTIIDAFDSKNKIKKTEDYNLHSWNKKTITALVAYIACKINDLDKKKFLWQEDMKYIIEENLWNNSGSDYYHKIDNFITERDCILQKKIKYSLLTQIGIEIYEKFEDI